MIHSLSVKVSLSPRIVKQRLRTRIRTWRAPSDPVKYVTQRDLQPMIDAMAAHGTQQGRQAVPNRIGQIRNRASTRQRSLQSSHELHR